MTREELREYVEELESQGEIPYYVYSNLIDCIDTLEQEPTTKNDLGVDCISREQAKEAIRYKFKDLPSRVEINTILNELPSVTPQEPRWIPVTERLPKENGGYLVAVKQGYVTTALWVGSAEKWKEITAWMPLPEPYGEDKE